MPDKKIHIYRPGEPHESSRLTKELSRVMAFFRETGTDRALTSLNRALKACFAADDTWRMVFCDEADSMPDCPGFRALFTWELKTMKDSIGFVDSLRTLFRNIEW